METIKKEKKAEGKLVKGGYASFNEYGELIEEGKMGNKLEQLLNSLIEKGWKPFNREKTLHITCYDKCKGLNYKWVHLDGGFMNEESRTLRELVSVDSGLWQFVCENGLYNYRLGELKNFVQDYGKHEKVGIGYHYLWDKSCYEYYIIESALKDESELEEFLLSNIKID